MTHRGESSSRYLMISCIVPNSNSSLLFFLRALCGESFL